MTPPLSSFTEEKLISFLKKQKPIFSPSSTNLLKGIGDDTAVLLPHKKGCTLVNTDMLIENTHFTKKYWSAEDVGYKAVSVNVSDIAAMGGQPEYLSIGLGLPSSTPWEEVQAFYQGVRKACKEYKLNLIGGDTTRSTYWVVAVHMTGYAAVPVYRQGAQPHDLLCLTGDIGRAHLSWQLLERLIKESNEAKNQTPSALLAKAYTVCSKDFINKLFRPKARMDVVQWLQENNLQPHAMTDVSDGLAQSIHDLCEKNNLGCTVWEEKLPMQRETKEIGCMLGIPFHDYALQGGEEYELLLTMPVESQAQLAACPFIHVIGDLHTQPEKFLRKKGEIIEIIPANWEHFC